MDYRWAYRVSLIYEFVTLLSLLLVCLDNRLVWYHPDSCGAQLVPETYAPVLLKRRAAKLRRETGDEKYWALLDRHDKSIKESILASIYTPFSEYWLTNLPTEFALTHE